jgi:hypothetical protein
VKEKAVKCKMGWLHLTFWTHNCKMPKIVKYNLVSKQKIEIHMEQIEHNMQWKFMIKIESLMEKNIAHVRNQRFWWEDNKRNHEWRREKPNRRKRGHRRQSKSFQFSETVIISVRRRISCGIFFLALFPVWFFLIHTG